MNVRENLLATLMEECAEVAKAASKILRAGPDSSPPGRGTSNIQELAAELTDLMAVVEELRLNGVDVYAHGAFDLGANDRKAIKLRHFIAVSRGLGCVEGPLAYGEALAPTQPQHTPKSPIQHPLEQHNERHHHLRP